MNLGITAINSHLYLTIDVSEDCQVVNLRVNPDEKTKVQHISLTKDDMKQLIRVLNFLGQEML